MDAYDIIARMLNRFGHVALVVLALYLGWATIGDRPFVVASTYVSTYVSPVLARSTPTSRLSQVNDLCEISRRSRRLAETILSDSDRRRLTFYADEMDDAARRMESEASSPKPVDPAPTKLAVQQ